jgi:hypothetical protein
VISFAVYMAVRSGPQGGQGSSNGSVDGAAMDQPTFQGEFSAGPDKQAENSTSPNNYEEEVLAGSSVAACRGDWSSGESPELRIIITEDDYEWRSEGRLISKGLWETVPLQGQTRVRLSFDGHDYNLTCNATRMNVWQRPSNVDPDAITRDEEWSMYRRTSQS